MNLLKGNWPLVVMIFIAAVMMGGKVAYGFFFHRPAAELAQIRGEQWLKAWGYTSRLESLKEEFPARPYVMVERRNALEKEIKKSCREAGLKNFRLKGGYWMVHYCGSSAPPQIELEGPTLLVYDEQDPP